MDSLIERIEAATGPSFAIDGAIGLAVCPERGSWPAYTASIDVAMTLVPDNCGIVIHAPVGKKPSVALQFGDESHPAPKTIDRWGDYSMASTLALSICLAALKARTLPHDR